MWPIIMMGFAPIYMWVIELVWGLVCCLVAGIVLVAIYEEMR